MGQLSRAARQLKKLVAPPPRRMSQSEVGKHLGVSPQAVRNWVNGIAVPTDEHKTELEKLLGIPFGDWASTEAEQAKTGTEG